MVPEGWVATTIAQSIAVGRGFAFKSEQYRETGHPILRVTNIGADGSISLSENCKFIDPVEASDFKKFELKDGDILLVMVGATTGKIGLVTTENLPALLNQNMWSLRAKPSSGLDQNFFSYIVSDVVEKFMSTLQGSARGFLTQGDFSKQAFAHPPLPEQQKIAEILGTWDKAIETTEALLTNARAQKRALMQSLLTGTRRFPEFDDHPWREVRLGDVAVCLDNKRVPLNSKQRSEMRGTIPYWGANGIVDYINDYIFDESLVLLAEDGGYFDEYATRPIACISYGKAWVNNHAHILRAGPEVNTEWLFFSLVHKDILGFINAGTRSKLNKGDMLTIPLALPSMAEQIRISDAIGSADVQVAKLMADLDHLRAEKKSLMQQLLTGERRVVV